MRKRKIKPRREYCKYYGGKVIFPTELDVRIELSNHQLYGTESRAYKCKWHNHYHISTETQLTEVKHG